MITPTRAEARFMIFWHDFRYDRQRPRSCWPTLTEAQAEAYRREDCGPIRIYDRSKKVWHRVSHV